MTFRGSLAPLAYPVGDWPSRAPVVRESRPHDAPEPRLLDRVREAIRARHYSHRTEEAYVAWIRRYVQIVLRGGKGDKDRATMLPAMAKLGLLRHLEDVRAQHEADLAMGAEWVFPATMIYTHVLNRGPAGVRSPADRMFAP